MKKKSVYITVAAPFGLAEQFVLAELKMLKRLGMRLMVVPRSPDLVIVPRDAADLIQDTLRTGMLSLRVLAGSVHCFVCKPISCSVVIGTVLGRSRNWRIAAKNLAVLPKAFFVATLIDRDSTAHIHSGWGTTPATIAWVLGRLTRIPWSMTLHRGDIVEDNLLKLKVAEAAFVRCISEGGRNLLKRIIGSENGQKVHVLHLGAEFDPVHVANAPEMSPFIIASAANLLPVKGLAYLVEACSILKRRNGVKFQCHIYGDGPLRGELRAKINGLGLDGVVTLRGGIPHDDLLGMYRKGQVGVFVLPSINTSDGQHEGIPVALMEAMSWGIPVISTDTGAISELVGGGAGILVRERDPEHLAEAIHRLMHDVKCRRELAVNARKIIAERFDLQSNTRAFVRLVEGISVGSA